MWLRVLIALVEYCLVASGLLAVFLATRSWTSVRFLVWVGIASLLLRLLWVVYAPGEPVSDFLYYHESAIDLASGLGYLRGGQPTAYIPIGYPAFLAVLYGLFGANATLGLFANVLLGTGCVLLTYLCSKSLFSEPYARVAAVTMAFFPGQIYGAAVLGSEIPTQTLGLLAFYGSLRLRLDRHSIGWLIPLGICIGIGVLVRPVLVVMIPVACVVWLMRRGSFRRIAFYLAILSAIVAMTLLPWIVRNYNMFHAFIPAGTNGGITFWWGHNEFATGRYRLTDPSAPERLFNGLSELELDRVARRRALEYIFENPGHSFWLTIKKAVYLFESDDYGLAFSFRRMEEGQQVVVPSRFISVWARISDAYFGSIMILVVLAFGLAATRRPLKRELIGLVCVITPVLFLTAFYMAFHANTRYNHTTIPMLAIVASWGLLQISNLRLCDLRQADVLSDADIPIS